jgi:glycine oxidase
LSEAAGFVMPHLVGTPATEIWVGFRPGSDGVQLGRWGSGGVYLAYGHYRNGILLAPLTAERAALEIGRN